MVCAILPGGIFCSGLLAQTVPWQDKLMVEGKIHYGFVIPHHENMIHLTPQHLTMLEADVLQATNGDRLWERQHRFPLKGISILYSDLGGAQYLGQVIACLPYLDFNLTRKHKVNLYFRFGAGVGYLTKKFDRLENYKNIAIGSHFNAGIQMMYEMRWKCTPRLHLTAGACLTHFSNGAIKTPNLGINIATVNAGLAYKMNARVASMKPFEKPEPLLHPWQFSVTGIFGVSELYAAYGPKFKAFVISGTAVKAVGKRSKRLLGVGLDIFYDEANIESLARLGTPVTHNLEVVRPGLNVTHTLVFSHLSLIMQLGGYVYTLYKTDGYCYDRIALQYRFKKHYNLHLALKTHLFRADMIEYGIGYTF